MNCWKYPIMCKNELVISFFNLLCERNGALSNGLVEGHGIMFGAYFLFPPATLALLVLGRSWPRNGQDQCLIFLLIEIQSVQPRRPT